MLHITKTVLLYSLLLFVNNSYAMHKPRLETVKNEDELRKFAGRFVVYTTASGYFGKNKGYPLYEHTDTFHNVQYAYKFGYIPHSHETDYSYLILNQLIRNDEDQNLKTLLTEMITQDTLRICSATNEETILIRDAVASGEAKLENMKKHTIIAMIMESLTQHKKNELATEQKNK